MQTCVGFGMKMPQWPDYAESIRQATEVEQAMTTIKANIESKGKTCGIIVVVVPQKSTQFYCK